MRPVDSDPIDLLVVGGGPIGATLALALADSDLDVRILDARQSGALGVADRTLALSATARLVFERVGIWSKLRSVTPIDTIDVSQKGAFGITQLSAHDLGVPALGYVVRYGELQAALDAALDDAEIRIDFGRAVRTIVADDDHAVVTSGSVAAAGGDVEHHAARLVAVADGSGESLPQIHRRKIDYRQHAIVGVVASDAMKRGVAYERFTADGPTALLPYEERLALVWTATPERAKALLALADPEFLDALHAHFGDRAGRFVSIGTRSAFPLSLQFATRVTARRAVVLGNAAQALHPIAGQGFNLGVRDMWCLAMQLLDTKRTAIGSPEALEAYERSRRVDRWAGVVTTHSLVRAFLDDRPLVALPRGLGLTILDSVRPLKRAFARAMLTGLR